MAVVCLFESGSYCPHSTMSSDFHFSRTSSLRLGKLPHILAHSLPELIDLKRRKFFIKALKLSIKKSTRCSSSAQKYLNSVVSGKIIFDENNWLTSGITFLKNSK